jgi:subtilisin family serine protease
MRRKLLIRAGLLILWLLACSAWADDRYILRCDPATLNTLLSRYGGVGLANSLAGSGQGVFVLNLPSGWLGAFIANLLQSDPAVQSLELDSPVALPVQSAASVPAAQRPKVPLLVDSRSTVSYFGTPSWGSYVSQPAASIIGVVPSHQYATGTGVVATIDTGIDFTHPALAGSLLPGWDFTRNTAGGSETADLNQDTTPILDQDTTPILDNSGTVVLNQDTTPILDQDTTPILDSRLPPAFGHGTMVAGLIHLVAPTAKIMPLKAFSADGSGNLSDIIAAIYYAVDHGAKVINMSFSTTQDSKELKRAIKYAAQNNVISVTSAGNDGANCTVYPAAYKETLDVGATSNSDQRSLFSNFGHDLDLAAPGEAVITTYPRNHYAAGWGTSFSAPLVAGAAALLIQVNPRIDGQGADKALSQANPLPGQLLGAGRLDLVTALNYQTKH